ncbi:MAG: dihydrofolate reductase [Candidatus Berkelbacteria bacterium Licking1014_7]|uniref:Dihydrofolate reductase n=1 Tax=Candidatus Berkelbacteria bacterium Licking1014_7 TaxID=2017147 RepID=A0A554LL36_9BACT|nr:MAG: dihydrofolate reductase [Candidatus Berkelbacteria bacterium Licking1014_7]
MNNSQPRISLIAAVGKSREIGKDNRLIWHIPEDLKRFKKITAKHAVIMGENTFFSLPGALPDRLNIVLTRDKKARFKNAVAAHSITEAVKKAKVKEKKEFFFIGGASVYAQALTLADRLYLTVIDQKFPGADTFFPDYANFSKVIFRQASQDQNYRYTFLILEK